MIFIFNCIFNLLVIFYFQNTGAGLVAAALISIVPGYISRSVAGSYDNEGEIKAKIFLIKLFKEFKNFIFILSISAIAIFCMLLTYYGWIKSVKTGSIFWALFTALAYFYMVSN